MSGDGLDSVADFVRTSERAEGWRAAHSRIRSVNLCVEYMEASDVDKKAFTSGCFYMSMRRRYNVDDAQYGHEVRVFTRHWKKVFPSLNVTLAKKAIGV